MANIAIKLKSAQSSESGFTIIESLIALLIVAILMTAIAPALVLSFATRIQARRVELASQAARAYMDGVKAGSINIPNQVVQLNEVNATNKTFSSQRGTFSGVAAPSSTLPTCSSPTNGYCQNSSNPTTVTTSLYCIDRDGGGCTRTSVQDFIIQAFRSTTATTLSAATDDATKGYLLGVRVYRADAFNGSSSLKTMKANNSKARTFTAGLGDRQTPLIEIVTEVSSKQTKFQDYCSRFGGCQ
ncbi:hormogonium polysaccharide secretion pseudopilin HpsB [Nostoc sp. LEGE 06077]|uniref:hormogonium polysaccharide secretion pseudopilin HpsB n=1 Tax=Nostoc sp. LEGE 06077 TaxID=915325 RepID=UPI003A100208